MIAVPLDYPGLLSDEEQQAYERRHSYRQNLRKTLAFLRDGRPPTGPVWDLGDHTVMTEAIEELWHCPIRVSGRYDLNWNLPQGRAQTILCLHVLEHLMNPLLCLTHARRRLTVDGRLFLATPLHRKIDGLGPVNAHHFQEFTRRQLRWLLEAARFTVLRDTTIRLWYPYIGVRSLLKGFSRLNVLMELEPC